MLAVVWLVVFIGGALATTGLGPLHSLVDTLRDVPFALAAPSAVALIMLAVPSPLVSTALGVAYGAALGSGVAIVAITIAAIIKWAVARRVIGSRFEARITARPRVGALAKQASTSAVAGMRLVGTPLIVLAVAGAVTRLSLPQFGAGIAIGSTPRTIAYAAFGSSLTTADPVIVGCIAIGLPVVGLLVASRTVRRIAS